MKRASVMAKVVTIIAVVVMSSALASAAIVDYQYNDDVGTNWKNIAQTGTDGGLWNGQVLDALTDGAGVAHFTGMAADQTRKHILDATVTSGIVALEFRINAWDMTDSVDKSGFQFALNSDVKLKVEAHTAGDGRNNLKILSIGSESPSPSKVFYNKSVNGDWDLILRAVADLDNNTYDTMYFREGFDIEWQALTTGGTFANDLTEVRMIVEGTTPWLTGEFIDLDYMTLSVVPEPATLALLGLGALVSRRRKRA